MPKISIIVPVYKVEQYIGMCLNSIIAQTFSDWEAICVNDGSPDKCGKILEQYAQKDNRIKVITQSNQGVSVARNEALKKATGEFICFVDSDDELALDFLEKMYEAITTENADIAWCDWYQEIKEKVFKNKWIHYTLYDDVFARFLSKNPEMGACIWNKLYRREVLKDFSFVPNLTIGEDLVFLYQVLYEAKRAIYIPQFLYYYRTRLDSAMNSPLSKKMIFGNIETAETLKNWFKDKYLPTQTRKILNQKIAKRMFKFAVLEPKRKDKENLDKWYALTQPLLAELKRKGVYQPKYLSIKNQIKSWRFLKGEKL